MTGHALLDAGSCRFRRPVYLCEHGLAPEKASEHRVSLERNERNFLFLIFLYSFISCIGAVEAPRGPRGRG